MLKTRPCLLGISFDGLGISGIVNEFINAADALRTNKFRVLFDLGFDITMGRTRDLHDAFLPPWIEVTKCIGPKYPKGYDATTVNGAFSQVVAGTRISEVKIYNEVVQELAAVLVAMFAREKLRFLIVENGTLPDNPIFTESLYLAIDEYGSQNKLNKYVMWRDHDLMWSAEPHLYGPYPYPGVRKPESNKHIHYFVATDWMRKRMEAWAPSATYNVLPNRFFSPRLRDHRPRRLREAFNIPQDSYLIARCTRVIPQKTIERDLRLLRELQLRLSANSHREIFLFVTGPTQEAADEFERLKALERTLSLAGRVIWGDGLLPFNQHLRKTGQQTDRFSVGDLLAESDISSFLTSYDYEGFGNPPGEAMAMGVPYIVTTYELYHEVYGSKGAIAPLLAINRDSTPADAIPDSFVDWTMRLLTDDVYRAQVGARNLDVCRRYFSMEALTRQLREVFGETE